MKAAIVLMMTCNKEKELHEMLRYAEIPDEIREEWAVKTIKRAIERGRKKAVPLAWREWADKWESGEDRTEETAKAVAKGHGGSVPGSRIALNATEAALALVSTEHCMQRNNHRYRVISGSCLVAANWSVAWVNNNNVSRRIMDAEITKQLDDLISLIEVYKEEQEESISDKLFNAAETDLERAVAQMAGERGEDCTDFVKDVLSGGCINGTVGELICYADTCAFYVRHKRDIQKLVTELMSDCGEASMKGLFGDKFDNKDMFCEDYNNQNLLAWFGFEEALWTLANRIELDI